MGYFSDIKEGKLPEDELILFIYENGIDDEYNKYAQEIEKYIEILDKNFAIATCVERGLLAKVLFILEAYKDMQDAAMNFVRRATYIHLHDGDQNFMAFMPKFIEKLDVEPLIEKLTNEIATLTHRKKEELRSFFNWCLHIIWNIPTFYNHSAWREFYPQLQILLDELMKQKRVDDVMYVEFFTYHIMGNSFHNMDEWREFNQNITKRTESFYRSFTTNLPQANPRQKEKKRIALVVGRIVFNSVFQVWYSQLKALMEDESFTNNYEIAVYSVNYFEKSRDEERCIEMVESLGILYINPVQEFIKQGYYNNHFEKALKVRKTLIQDDIDILITGGVFPIIDFLYLSRVTPLQIYWSHGNCAFDIEGIDKRISHFDQECKEFAWKIFSVPMAKEFLIGTDGEKQVGEIIKADFKQRFGEDLVILGTIGRLIKINSDEYIQTVAQIMKENPNTIYLACGTGNEEDIKEKLDKYGIDQKCFIFTGQVNPHIYGWVIDVWPDSFPLRQGQSKNEYIAKGGIVVFIEEYLNDTIRNWYQDSDINVCAKDIEDYINLVSLYINDLEERKKVSEFNKTIFDEYSDMQDFIEVLNG